MTSFLNFHLLLSPLCILGNFLGLQIATSSFTFQLGCSFCIRQCDQNCPSVPRIYLVLTLKVSLTPQPLLARQTGLVYHSSSECLFLLSLPDLFFKSLLKLTSSKILFQPSFCCRLKCICICQRQRDYHILLSSGSATLCVL